VLDPAQDHNAADLAAQYAPDPEWAQKETWPSAPATGRGSLRLPSALISTHWALAHPRITNIKWTGSQRRAPGNHVSPRCEFDDRRTGDRFYFLIPKGWFLDCFGSEIIPLVSRPIDPAQMPVKVLKTHCLFDRQLESDEPRLPCNSPRFLTLLAEIEDPRRAEGKLYRLPHVVLFAILAMVAGANSYRSIHSFIDVHFVRLRASSSG
jgi:hypothetical protein